MKTPAEINSAYNGLMANVADLEEQLKALAVSNKKNKLLPGYVLVVAVPLSILAANFIPAIQSENLAATLFVGNTVLFLGSLFYLMIKNNSQYKPVRAAFTERIIKPMVKSINLELNLDPNKKIDSAELKATGMLGRPDFSTGGLITGLIGKTTVRASEAEAFTQVQSDGGKNIKFKGLYAILKTPVDFGAGIYIRPSGDQQLQSLAGGAITKLLTGKVYGETVPTNHATFDQNYNVSALDSGQAKKFIDSSLFQTIATMSNTISGNPRFYLKGNELHIALEGNVILRQSGALDSFQSVPIPEFSKNLNFIVGVAEAVG